MANNLPIEAFRAFPVAKRIAEDAGQPVPPLWSEDHEIDNRASAPRAHRLLCSSSQVGPGHREAGPARLAHPDRLAVHVGNATLVRPRKRRLSWAALLLWLGVPAIGWGLMAALSWALLP